MEHHRGVRAELRRQVRNAGKRLRRLQVPEEEQLLERPLPREALLVFVLAQHQACVAVDFLRGIGLSQKCPHASVDKQVLSDYLVDAYISADDEVLRDLLDPPSSQGVHAQMYKAAKYVVEHKLFAWTSNQNIEHGVAPSRAQLVEQALDAFPAGLPAAVAEDLARPLRGTARTQRKWLASFRRRWGARVGKLRIREHLDTSAIHAKVLLLAAKSC
jgi:hypothetical protein